jgi:hypothetical protein
MIRAKVQGRVRELVPSIIREEIERVFGRRTA